MNAIRGVLKEGLERLESLSKKYRANIRKLPKGSISKKERKGHLYAYLARREKGKVSFLYIGNVKSDKVKKLKEEIASRRKYENNLKRVEKEIKELKRIVLGSHLHCRDV